jgi:hypothetical protein
MVLSTVELQGIEKVLHDEFHVNLIKKWMPLPNSCPGS